MPVEIQPSFTAESTLTARFIKKVYDTAIAPTYSEEGNTEFYKYINAEALEKRLGDDHWMLKAVEGDTLLGIIEIRKNEHLSMLFVDTIHQKQGIGRQLLAEAITKMRELNPEQKTISVHATPNALAAYQKLGFHAVSEEQNIHGIKFVSMEKPLV